MLHDEPVTICCICSEDYGDMADECFIGDVCPDCRDNNNSDLETLLDAALTPKKADKS